MTRVDCAVKLYFLQHARPSVTWNFFIDLSKGEVESTTGFKKFIMTKCRDKCARVGANAVDVKEIYVVRRKTKTSAGQRIEKKKFAVADDDDWNLWRSSVLIEPARYEIESKYI